MPIRHNVTGDQKDNLDHAKLCKVKEEDHPKTEEMIS